MRLRHSWEGSICTWKTEIEKMNTEREWSEQEVYEHKRMCVMAWFFSPQTDGVENPPKF